MRSDRGGDKEKGGQAQSPHPTPPDPEGHEKCAPKEGKRGKGEGNHDSGYASTRVAPMGPGGEIAEIEWGGTAGELSAPGTSRVFSRVGVKGW